MANRYRVLLYIDSAFSIDVEAENEDVAIERSKTFPLEAWDNDNWIFQDRNMEAQELNEDGEEISG